MSGRSRVRPVNGGLTNRVAYASKVQPSSGGSNDPLHYIYRGPVYQGGGGGGVDDIAAHHNEVFKSKVQTFRPATAGKVRSVPDGAVTKFEVHFFLCPTLLHKSHFIYI
jgi:hypothetical protein